MRQAGVQIRSSGGGESTTRRWLVGALTATMMVSTLVAITADVAVAQTDTPTDVTVEQRWGFATVSWDPVEGATHYQIERTLMDGDMPAETPRIVGLWEPTRYMKDGEHPHITTFADSGFVLGERYRWRVRATFGSPTAMPGPWSDAVVDDTLLPVGPEEFLTGFELSGNLQWTTHESEVAWIERLADASDRVRLETIGETYEGRPMHLAVIGDPAPPTLEEIVDSPTVFLTCTVHGSERSGREACMMLLRQLAFSDDPWVTDILEEATVLINPTANPDGQSVGRRTNTAGQDLNRDHLLVRHPEAVAIAETIRDYQPQLIVDAHEKGGGPDNDPMWSRSRIINEDLVEFAQDDMVLGRYFHAGYDAGWSMLPYTVLANNNWEAWLHNTAGMKNKLGMLLETPIQTTTARPGEGTPGGDRPLGRARRVYTQLWSLHVMLDYHRDNLDEIEDVIRISTEANANNVGPIYLDGAYEAPYVPPPSEPYTVKLDPAPCGYRLSPEQLQVRDSGTLIGPLQGQPWQSQTVEERLAVHGIEVEAVGVAGIKQVRLAQPLRPVIPYILDPELDTEIRPIGTPNIGMVDATRLDDRRATVYVGSVATSVQNRVGDDGCSINDLIADEQEWPNRAFFRSHVNQVVNQLRADGLIDQREASEIRIAATRSGIG